MSVVLDHHAAAARRDDDRFRTVDGSCGPPCVDVALDGRERDLFLIEMMRQRTAASAAGDGDERNADAVEHSRHRGVDRSARATPARSRQRQHLAGMPRGGPCARGLAIRNPRGKFARQKALERAVPSRAPPRTAAPTAVRHGRPQRFACSTAGRPTLPSTTRRPMSSRRPYLHAGRTGGFATETRETAIEVQLRLFRGAPAPSSTSLIR